MKKIIGICFGLTVIIFAGSCKKDDIANVPVIPPYTVDTVYHYTNNGDSINVAKLLLMADQIGAAINLGSTPNTVVDAAKLKAMFNGTGGYFNDSSATLKLNTSGLSLASICPAAMVTDINRYFDSIALYSQSTVTASQGTAGTAASGTKKYLLSANGIFYSQLFKKTINGLCSYQIANKYMSDSIYNTTDVATLGHYWDRAFGFFAVPNNFPASFTGTKYAGAYCRQVNPGMNSNASIMNAFLKGRAAINNSDFATMKAQARLLIATLDTLNAACVVQEMHETEANIAASDKVASYGTMSETLGFVRNFTYNTKTRVITDAQITNLLKLIDNANPANPDMYNFVNTLQGQTPGPTSNTEIIAKYIQQVYGFTDAQLPLL